jgi:Pyruvate/2-oxoacid:ferredoxin oxidoreductase delta subunit
LPKELIEQETGAIIEQGVEVEQREWRWEDQDRFEAVFLATGLRDATSLPPVPSLVTVENGRILVDAGCPTNRKGLFAGGEVARGRQSVAEAIGDGKRGAMAIDSYLQGKNLLQDLEGFSIGGGGSLSFEFFGSGAKQEKKVRRVVHYTDLNPALFSKRARVEVPTRSVEIEEGKSEEIEFGVSKEGAIEEASRCLQCGACNRCGRCLFDCPEGAISHGARSPRGMEIDYDFCKGCGICRNECPRGMFIFEKEETDWE